jgi:S1-C subfamily serine protease
MALKKHHKIIIGGFSSIIIIFMVITGILLNAIIVKQQINHNEVLSKIENLEADTQSKLNELSEALIETRNDVNSLTNQVGTIDQQFEELKSSVSEDFSKVVEDSIESVVTIKTDAGQGTGFIITGEGFIITNAHVLSGGKTVKTITYEQQEIKTSFIGYNADLDLALLKITGEYTPLKLADSDNVQIGEKVIAIGNPLGLQFSVSQGIVSGVHRTGPNGLDAYIQTDAALNPGNSGGPLINTAGKVIGINNFKSSSAESLGFALESNYIKDAVNAIAKEELNMTLLS